MRLDSLNKQGEHSIFPTHVFVHNHFLSSTLIEQHASMTGNKKNYMDIKFQHVISFHRSSMIMEYRPPQVTYNWSEEIISISSVVLKKKAAGQEVHLPIRRPLLPPTKWHCHEHLRYLDSHIHLHGNLRRSTHPLTPGRLRTPLLPPIYRRRFRKKLLQWRQCCTFLEPPEHTVNQMRQSSPTTLVEGVHTNNQNNKELTPTTMEDFHFTN